MRADNNQALQYSNVIAFKRSEIAPVLDQATDTEVKVHERYEALIEHYGEILIRMDRILNALKEDADLR